MSAGEHTKGEDERATRDRVRGLANQLASEHSDDPMIAGNEIVAFANHPSAPVRQIVAEACEHLPAVLVDSIIAPLLDDEDAYVQRAAERAMKKRAIQTSTALREDAEAKIVAGALEALTTKYGKAARRLAERAMKRDKEYFLRKLHHELIKIYTPLDMSLHRLQTEVRKAPVDAHAMARHADAARERLSYLWSVIVSARSSTATIKPTFGEERVWDLVETARGQLIDRLGAASSRLTLHNEVDRALVIEADKNALLQAFQNILQNGAEAVPAGAPIELRVASRTLRAGSQVVLSFTDNGLGMTKEIEARLFVPFGSEKPGGAGLGLMVVRNMVEEVHGGALAFDTAPGKGTTLKITLPSRQEGTKRG